MPQRILCIVLSFCLLPLSAAQAGFPQVHAGEAVLSLPVPGTMVHLSVPVNPAMLKGIKVDPNNPFKFEFVVDKGDGHLFDKDEENFKKVTVTFIKYFLAAITTPEKDLWVNLSPYEKDRIVPDSFGQTEMGRDLLAQDYLLKQLTASLIYPEDEIGKKFWKKVYEQTTNKNVAINTFNKVWIVPDKTVVFENAKNGTAYVVESSLKVLTEQDYLATDVSSRAPASPAGGPKERGDLLKIASPTARNDTNKVIKETEGSLLSNKVLQDIVIPQLTKDVNTGSNFAQLRQVYNSFILAMWYKKKIKNSILSQVYADKNKVKGTEYNKSVIASDQRERGDLLKIASSSSTPCLPAGKARNDTEIIYQQYLESFKKGAYNIIKEDMDVVSGKPVPRKYFSGGVMLHDFSLAMTATPPENLSQGLEVVKVDMAMSSRYHDITKKLGVGVVRRVYLSFQHLVQANPGNHWKLPHDVDTIVNKRTYLVPMTTRAVAAVMMTGVVAGISGYPIDMKMVAVALAGTVGLNHVLRSWTMVLPKYATMVLRPVLQTEEDYFYVANNMARVLTLPRSDLLHAAYAYLVVRRMEANRVVVRGDFQNGKALNLPQLRIKDFLALPSKTYEQQLAQAKVLAKVIQQDFPSLNLRDQEIVLRRFVNGLGFYFYREKVKNDMLSDILDREDGLVQQPDKVLTDVSGKYQNLYGITLGILAEHALKGIDQAFGFFYELGLMDNKQVKLKRLPATLRVIQGGRRDDKNLAMITIEEMPGVSSATTEETRDAFDNYPDQFWLSDDDIQWLRSINPRIVGHIGAFLKKVTKTLGDSFGLTHVSVDGEAMRSNSQFDLAKKYFGQLIKSKTETQKAITIVEIGLGSDVSFRETNDILMALSGAFEAQGVDVKAQGQWTITFVVLDLSVDYIEEFKEHFRVNFPFSLEMKVGQVDTLNPQSMKQVGEQYKADFIFDRHTIYGMYLLKEGFFSTRNIQEGKFSEYSLSAPVALGNTIGFLARKGTYLMVENPKYFEVQPTFQIPGLDLMKDRIVDSTGLYQVQDPQELKRVGIKGFIEMQEKNMQEAIENGWRPVDAAMRGGIDLTTDKVKLDTKQDVVGSIKFHFTPAQIEQFKNAPGFEPVIISILPLTDLHAFLGVN